MFDTLVESKSNAGEAAKQGSYLGITALIYGSLFLALFVWSLYSFDAEGMLGGGNLDSASLVAPVPVPETEPPPPPAPEVKQERQAAPEKSTNVDVRTQLIQDINEAPKEPDRVSSVASKEPPRRQGVATVIGAASKNATGGGGDPDAPPGVGTGGPSTPIVKAPPPVTQAAAPPPPPPPPPAPKASPTAPPVPKVVSKGVITGSATSLPKPPYPPAAKAVRASGAVSVQVLIDENGNVVSASAVSGHPLLKAAAAAAARQAKFSPTKLSGQPVKVSGTIVYNFAP